MELKHSARVSIFILHLNIVGLHFGNGTVTFLLSTADDDSDSADLNALGNDKYGFIGFEFLFDGLDGFVHIDVVLALDEFKIYLFICHYLYNNQISITKSILITSSMMIFLDLKENCPELAQFKG